MSDTSEFHQDFASLARRLLEESPRSGNPVGVPIREHLGVPAEEFTVHAEELADFELPNLQLALEAALARPDWGGRIVGLAGQGGHFPEIGLGDLMANEHLSIGPPEYVNAPVGPGRTLPCLVWAVLLVTAPGGSPRRPRASRPGARPDAWRLDRAGGRARPHARLALPRRSARADAGTRRLPRSAPDDRGRPRRLERGRLPRAARHGCRRARASRRTAGADRPPRRRAEPAPARAPRHGAAPRPGPPPWGPPGTGKSHTVRYLTGLLTDATVVVLSGPSLGFLGAFGNLARRLAPAVVVLEDVDLVAQERSHGPFGSSPLLFELMNEMSGLAADADVAFVLTTNRPDTLEPALAAQPGRIDLALEIPLPAAAVRRRLLELYGQGLDLDATLLDEAVDRTEGATASFFRELLRKAAVAALEAGHDR